MNKLKYILIAALLMPVFQSCGDFFDLDAPEPNNAVEPDFFITNRQSAQAAVAGAYDGLQNFAFDGHLSLWQYFSDECDFTGTFPTRLEFGNFNVQTANTTMATVFTNYYVAINRANDILDVLPTVDDISLSTEPELVNSFLAEARMVRAISYFYLWQGWNEVPLILTPTRSDAVGDELNVPKATADEIVRQIGEDLDFAEANLVDGASLGITTTTVAALKARVALYRGDNQAAYDQATAALGAGFDLTNFGYLDDVIFQVEYSSTDGASYAFFYGPASFGGRHSIEPSATLIGAYEDGDIRKDLSVDLVSSSVPFGIKYDNFAASSGAQDDPILMFRHSEQVLIAAEAAARLGNFMDANMWFNQVRQRAGLSDLTLDAGNFEDLILQERFVELAMEGGHRLWDLRRTGNAFDVLNPLGYDTCDDVWPLPQRDIDRNVNLQQNGCCNC